MGKGKKRGLDPRKHTRSYTKGARTIDVTVPPAARGHIQYGTYPANSLAVAATSGLGDSPAQGVDARTKAARPRHVEVRSPLLDRAADRVRAMRPDDAIAAIIGTYAELARERPMTGDDGIAALYLAGRALVGIPEADWGPYLDRLATALPYDRANLASDIRHFNAEGTLHDAPPPARPAPPPAPPHWRDALDGLGKIAAFWADQRTNGSFPQQALCYGNGWLVLEDTYEGMLAARELDAAQGDRITAAITAHLDKFQRNAVPAYVAPPIAALLFAAAATVPPTTLDLTLLFARAGLLWFGEPFDYYAAADDNERARFRFEGADMVRAAEKAPHLGRATPERLRALLAAGPVDTRPRLQAFGWHPVVGHWEGAPEDELEERLLLTCYFTHRLPGDFPLQMADFSCELAVVIRPGDVINPDPDAVRAASSEGYAAPGTTMLFNLFAATLLFMKQTILRPEARAVENKGARRRLEKTLGRTPPEVQVIRLREYAAPPDDDTTPDTGASARAYSCQWMTRGHWHQYRVGPGKKRLEPRYVGPYIKGPKDKPLVLRPVVVAVQR